MSGRVLGSTASTPATLKITTKPSNATSGRQSLPAPSSVASSSNSKASSNPAVPKDSFQLADALSLVKTARAAGLNLPDNATYIFMPPKTLNGGPTPSTSSLFMPKASPKTPVSLKRSHSQVSMKNDSIEKNKNIFSTPQPTKKRSLFLTALRKTSPTPLAFKPLFRRPTRSAVSFVTVKPQDSAASDDDDTSEMEASTSSGISSEVEDKSRAKKNGEEGGKSRPANDNEYEIERIVRRRVSTHGGGKRTRYLIKWLGHDEMTWEPRNHFATNNDAWLKFKQEEKERSEQKRLERKKKKVGGVREGSAGSSGRKSEQSGTPDGDRGEVDGPADTQKNVDERGKGEGEEKKDEQTAVMVVEEEESMVEESDKSTTSLINIPESRLDPEAAMKELEELDVEDMTLTSNTPLKKTSFQPTIVTVEPKKSAAEITPAAIEPSTSSQQKTPSTSTDFPSSFTVLAVGPAVAQPKEQALTLTKVISNPTVRLQSLAKSTEKNEGESTPVTSIRPSVSTMKTVATSSPSGSSPGSLPPNFPFRNAVGGVHVVRRPEVTISGNVYTIRAIKRPSDTTSLTVSPVPRPIMTVVPPQPAQKKINTGVSVNSLPSSPEIAVPSTALMNTVAAVRAPVTNTSRIFSNLMTVRRALPPVVQFRAPVPQSPSTSNTSRSVTFNKNVVHIPHANTVPIRPPVAPIRRPVNPFATVKTIMHTGMNTTLACVGAKSLIPDMGATGKSGLESGSLVVGITGFKPREAGITCLNDVSFLVSYADRDSEFVDYEVCIQKIPHEVAEFLFKNRIYALDSQPVRQN